MLSTKGNLEASLSFLRGQGYSKFDSIRVLVREGGYSLADAKAAVHLSSTWGDLRVRDDEVHDALFDACDEADRASKREHPKPS